MLQKLMAKVRRNRQPLTDRELAEQETLRRQAEQELLRAEARMAEERAPLDAYSHGNMAGPL
jgi:hypothetical protein